MHRVRHISWQCQTFPLCGAPTLAVHGLRREEVLVDGVYPHDEMRFLAHVRFRDNVDWAELELSDNVNDWAELELPHALASTITTGDVLILHTDRDGMVLGLQAADAAEKKRIAGEQLAARLRLSGSWPNLNLGTLVEILGNNQAAMEALALHMLRQDLGNPQTDRLLTDFHLAQGLWRDAAEQKTLDLIAREHPEHMLRVAEAEAAAVDADGDEAGADADDSPEP